MKDVIQEAIERFMAQVPEIPFQNEREWSSEDMAGAIVQALLEAGVSVHLRKGE